MIICRVLLLRCKKNIGIYNTNIKKRQYKNQYSPPVKKIAMIASESDFERLTYSGSKTLGKISKKRNYSEPPHKDLIGLT